MEEEIIVDKRFGDIHSLKDFLLVSHEVRKLAEKPYTEMMAAVMGIRYPFLYGTANDSHTFSAFLALDSAGSAIQIYKKSRRAFLDFWQFPHETLMLGYGDCEDTSILLGGLARAREMDYWVVVGAVYADQQLLGYHAWVHLLEEGAWKLIETTLDAVPEGGWPGISVWNPDEINYKGLVYVPFIFWNHDKVEEVKEFLLTGRRISWNSARLSQMKEKWR